MPYQTILPLFGGALSLGLVLLALCAVVPSLRGALPYGWRMLVGGSLGFVLANLASLALGVLPAVCASVWHLRKDSPLAALVAGCAMLGLFVGPLVLSPLGFAAGAWWGARRARRTDGSGSRRELVGSPVRSVE